ncbi:MAG: hypothetical protein NTX49_08585 [Chlamydiae bacterium]|nr:hypothetical protein [Chlamydiota bacterium]
MRVVILLVILLNGNSINAEVVSYGGITRTVEDLAANPIDSPDPSGQQEIEQPVFSKYPSGAQAASTSPIEVPFKIAKVPSSVNFTAVTLSDTRAFPPDSMGVVGPTQFVAVCNGIIRSFSKTTGLPDGVLNMNTGTFFSSVLQPGAYTGDPRVRYDRLSGSWFVTMLGFTNIGEPVRLMIAVARSGTITNSTSWHFYYFLPASVSPPRSSPNDFTDFPTLGIDAKALYIGANIFSPSGYFLNVDAFVIPKASLLAGTLNVYAFRDLIDNSAGPITPQGVDNFDPGATVGYFVGVDAYQYGKLTFRKVTNPGTTPTLSGNIGLTVLSTCYPSAVPHQGNLNGVNGRLDSIDDRLGSTHIRNGHLYTAHNVGTNSSGVSSSSLTMTADGCRWYEISMADPNHPALLHAGTLYDPLANATHRRNYWIPSVMTNGVGTMAIGCSTAGTFSFADSAYALRYAADPAGTLRPSVLYTSTTSSYNPPGDPGGSGGRRWGDYSHTSVDPQNNLTMWTIQEYCNAPNFYGCRVISIPASPPVTPTSCTPSHIALGRAPVQLVIKGTSVNGSAFYDPPSGFANHLSVTIGNLHISSFSVVSPTELHVTVSTVGATKGAKTITITNPDGQQSSASTLLSIP